MSTSAARELLSVNINMVLESEILDRALRAMLEAEAGGNRRGSDKGSDTEAAAAAAAAASEIRQDRTSIVSDDGEGGEGEGEGEGSVSDATLPPEAVDGSLETALVLLRVCDDLRKLAAPDRAVGHGRVRGQHVERRRLVQPAAWRRRRRRRRGSGRSQRGAWRGDARGVA